MLALGKQVIELRLLFLAVAVNATVALLEGEQRPRDVEVNHPMAEVVQVDALGSDIGRDEQAQRRGFVAEGFDDGLLVHVGHAAVKGRDLVGAQSEVQGQIFF